MSTLKVDTVEHPTSSSAVDLPNKLKIGGATIEQGYTASGSEPGSANTGDWWWDTSNDKLYRYINGEFKLIGMAVVPVSGYNGARGFWYGGSTTSSDSSRTNIIDYVTIATPGNATDFGNLTESMGRNGQGASNGVRGVRLGGEKSNSSKTNTMDYITCATPGNATDFGNLSSAREEGTGASNGTRGLAIGGYASSSQNVIEYITISTTGNATDFGDCLTTKVASTGVNGETRALVCGTTTSAAHYQTIEYIVVATTGNSVDFGDLTGNHNRGGSAADASRAVIALGYDTIASTDNQLCYVANDTAGNAQDFGDLTVGRYEQVAGCSDGTYAVFGGGQVYNTQTKTNTIDYVTIQTTGNAQDFGDLTVARLEQGSFGGNAA